MLYQRGAEGYPEGADQYMKDSYGMIPDAEFFQSARGYGYQKPISVFGWSWSTTFNCWRALVKFDDGWEGYTSPAPWKKHHNDCPVCQGKLSRYSPDGIDVIYECDGHHRHLLKGLTGEYLTLRPSIPKQGQDHGC